MKSEYLVSNKTLDSLTDQQQADLGAELDLVFNNHGVEYIFTDVPEGILVTWTNDAEPSTDIEVTEPVKPTVITEVSDGIFDASHGSYFLSDEIIENTPIEQFALFAAAMQEVQVRAGVSFTADATSTGILIAWRTRAA